MHRKPLTIDDAIAHSLARLALDWLNHSSFECALSLPGGSREPPTDRIGFNPERSGANRFDAGNELGTGTEVRGAQSLFPPLPQLNYLSCLPTHTDGAGGYT
jgi:hypothetical protein